MKNNAVYKLVALAASVAIAGCVAPGSLTKLDTASKVASTQAAQNTGTLQLNVHWPQKGGLQTQAIPDRAARVVVTLTDKDNGQLGTAEAGRSPNYGNRIDTYSSNFNWTLPQQEGVKVKAVLYDESDGEVGSAERVIDVVAGFNAYVTLDILIPDAPQVTTVNPTAFKTDDKVVITGSGFGKSKNFWATAYLESEGVFSNQYSPFPYQYNYQVNLPGSAVNVISDTQMEVTIPDQMEYSGRLTDRLWNYFHGDDTQKLYLGVVVDGVNSNRIEVTMPKVASASATVTLQEGTDAPAHTSAAPETIDLASESFNVPIASGTQWTYRVTEDYGGPYSQPYTNTCKLRLTDDDGMAEIVASNYNNGQPMTWDYLTPGDTGENWLLGFMFRLRAAGAIQNVGQEEVMLPSGYQKPATHYFYNLPQYVGPNMSPDGFQTSGTFRDVWVVPGLGVVRAVDTRLEKSPYDQFPRRVTRTYDMTGFQPVAATVK
ncbi:MAG TPA: hypothetical protein V6D05_04020 [Stenomitos sp.]